MFDILGVLILVLLAAAFGWLAARARRARHPGMKWGGLLVSGLLAFVFAAAVLVAGIGFYRLNVPPHRNPVADVRVASTPDLVARGERFAAICATCHSATGKVPLAGQDFGKDGPPVGRLYASNLTPAGEIKDWSDGEVIRAIREGIHKSGRPLIIMPSEIFRDLSDTDVQAIVAYLRSQPAVPPGTPPTRLNVLAALFVGSGMFPTSAQAPITRPVVAPPRAPRPTTASTWSRSPAATRVMARTSRVAGRVARARLPDPTSPRSSRDGPRRSSFALCGRASTRTGTRCRRTCRGRPFRPLRVTTISRRSMRTCAD